MKIYFNTSIFCAQKPLIDKAADKLLWAQHALFHGRKVTVEGERVVRDEKFNAKRPFFQTLLAIILLLPGSILGASLKLLASLSASVRHYRQIVSRYDLQQMAQPKVIPKGPLKDNPPSFSKEVADFLELAKKQPALRAEDHFKDASGKIRNVIGAEAFKALTSAVREMKDPGFINLEGQSVIRDFQGKEDLSGMRAFAQHLADHSRLWYRVGLPSTGLNDAAIDILSEGISKAAATKGAQIQGVDVSQNSFSIPSLKKLVDSLNLHACSNFHINGCMLGIEGAKIVAPWLEKRCTSHLYMNGCGLKAEGMRLVAQALEKQPYDPSQLKPNSLFLRWHMLQNNACGDEGAKAIASLIRKTIFPSQNVFKLQNNQITYQGFKAILEAVAALPHPKFHSTIDIDLSNNKISLPNDPKEIQDIEALLAKCHWQFSITLKNNPVNPPKKWLQLDIRHLHTIGIGIGFGELYY